MLVSIITITFNSERHLEQTIQSVLGQDYPDIEYIIIDGRSTDCTLDIIRKYEDRIAIWVSEPDEGISDAMNKGIRMSSGEIIGIIHSDDYYEPGAVTAVVRTFEEHGDVDVVHGDLRFWNPSETSSVIQKPREHPEKVIWRLMPYLHPTVFVKKEAYEKYGLFDLSYKMAMDRELMLRFLKGGARFHYLEQVIANMRTTGISQTQLMETFREGRDVAIRHGHSRLRAYSYYLYRIIFKKTEKMSGQLLRRIGLRWVTNLYRRLFYRHVPGDY